MIEHTYPLRVERYTLVPDSEGAGRFRGGCGLTREFRILTKSVMLTVSSDRAEIGPWGVKGGQPGARSNCTVTRPDGAVRRLGSKVSTYLERDDLLATITPGGGGWGDPYQRDPDHVRWDVVEGLISTDRARAVYGVAIDPATVEIDQAVTAELRSGRSTRAEPKS